MFITILLWCVGDMRTGVGRVKGIPLYALIGPKAQGGMYSPNIPQHDQRQPCLWWPSGSGSELYFLLLSAQSFHQWLGSPAHWKGSRVVFQARFILKTQTLCPRIHFKNLCFVECLEQAMFVFLMGCQHYFLLSWWFCETSDLGCVLTQFQAVIAWKPFGIFP